jgi:hypothetical protein
VFDHPVAAARHRILLDMGLPDVLLDIWQNGGQAVVIGAGGYVVARRRDAGGSVGTNDRLIAAQNRDLARWVRDRDRQLDGDLKLLDAYARDPDLEGEFVDRLVALKKPVPDQLKNHPVGSQYGSGWHLAARAKFQSDALHQYRDRATSAFDEFDELVGTESRIHGWIRRRRNTAAPRLRLPDDCTAIVARWREDATVPRSPHHVIVDDPTRGDELEARFRDVEGQ